MESSELVSIELSKIRENASMRFNIYDDRGVLLLATGQRFTAKVRHRLEKRNVVSLKIASEDLDLLRLDTPAGDAPQPRPSRTLDKNPRRVRKDRRGDPLSVERAAEFRRKISTAAASVYTSAQNLGDLGDEEIRGLCQIPQSLIDMLLEDCDQTASLLNERKEPRLHLAQRCIRMSVLAINTGIEMGLPENRWLQLGIAGLLHDLALFEGPESFRVPGTPMTANEYWEYRQHSRKVAAIFRDAGVISEEICLIMSQVHEKDDGTGFPHGLSFNALHPLSRVLHVVDAYLRLIEPGLGRLPLLPHDAIRLLSVDLQRRHFCSDVIDAFIDQMTVYPIGSTVELDDGKLASVIRRDGEYREAPIVQIHGEHSPLRLTGNERKIRNVIVPAEDHLLRLNRSNLHTFADAIYSPAF
jgi:HD-GYP domain-containing protein (c-di-GMP phosphodiesterase class II)